MRPRPIRCDIFCTVIDNFGDVGVCWRLAQQLATEFAWQVRLLIDDASALEWLATPSQHAAVRISDFHGAEYENAEVVIEAFACEIPPAFQAAMAARKVPLVWLNLEYLSAENWVATSHGLASKHPHLPLTKYFFFPGFDAASGGLIRERDYDTRRLDFDATAFRQRHGLPVASQKETVISLFSYPNAPRDALYAAWAASATPILAVLPGNTDAPWQRGNLRVHPLPFLSQREYDELLWLCDLNFVRGEDSFVRAQWAEKAMVWQIYPQENDTHLVKLKSFLTRYSPVGAGDTLYALFMQAWNTQGTPDWPAFASQLPQLNTHAKHWADALRQHPDLATNLVDFCLTRLKID